MEARSTTGMIEMGMSAVRPWLVIIWWAVAIPMTLRSRRSNGVTTMAAMAHAAMAHTTTQYWRCENHVKACVDSPALLSPTDTPAICRSSACSSAMTSRASSTVTIPRIWRFSSQTGMATRSYLVISVGHLLLVEDRGRPTPRRGRRGPSGGRCDRRPRANAWTARP